MTTALAPAPSADALGFIAKPTPQLRTALGQFETTLPPAEFAAMLGCIRSVFGKYTAKLLEFPAGAGRGMALHRMMDREMEAAAAVPVSCGKGCAGCCHYEVEITRDEAELLKQVVQAGFPLDLDRLEKQAARERKSAEWSRFWSPKNQCVFLGADGACQVYAVRPAICRKHLVTNPAGACTTAGAAVTPVQVLMAEILLSAALSLEGAVHASLSKMLWAALRAGAGEGGPGAGTVPPARALLERYVAEPPAEYPRAEGTRIDGGPATGTQVVVQRIDAADGN